MARPCKCRRIGGPPQADYFKPRGVPLADLPEVNLTMDEFEAVRLADLLGLYQEEAARRMDVSRQTFGNIIESARKKIADAIVNAKALKIEGGVVKIRNCPRAPRNGSGDGLGKKCRFLMRRNR
jgi:predicted DNA-binding protein (UPF0251 family)